VTLRLARRVAVITGAAHGIGAGIARRFAREGAVVIVADRDGEGAETVASELHEVFDIISGHITANVGYENQVISMIEKVIRDYGRIDVLVNNAQGFNGMAALEEKTTGEFDYSLRTGLYASFWAMRAAFPQMRAQGGGSIINLTSIDAVTGRPLLSDYDVAKEAIHGLTKVAAREWGQYQIRVNSIAPFAASAIVEQSAQRLPEFAAALAAAPPLGRIGDCENDIGGAALFLATDDSRYVTGTTLFADGGMFLAPPPVPTTADPSWPRPERRLQWISGDPAKTTMA
jgi:3-oxoacyl-[acyl-carrier protein] reductase